MAPFSGGGTERTTDRLEAFSDAVLAIAITLPVVELHAPRSDDGDLAAGYLRLEPDYAAYGISVILIGLYWAHSHFTGKLLQKTDHGHNLLTVGFLAAVSITPFPARPLLEHLVSDAESKTAAIVYLGVAAAPATWWFLRWIYATARSLTDPRLTDVYLNRITINYGIPAASYWAAFAVAFWDWGVGLIAAGIVTLTYLVPPARPAFTTDVQSTTALEMADKKRD